jgi:hypothetical protein
LHVSVICGFTLILGSVAHNIHSPIFRGTSRGSKDNLYCVVWCLMCPSSGILFRYFPSSPLTVGLCFIDKDNRTRPQIQIPIYIHICVSSFTHNRAENESECEGMFILLCFHVFVRTDSSFWPSLPNATKYVSLDDKIYNG